MSDIENDKRIPGADNVVKIADALGASLEYLLRGRAGSGNLKLNQIEISKTLSEAAQEGNWSFRTTSALQELANATQFMSVKSMHWARDWKQLYEALMKFNGRRPSSRP